MAPKALPTRDELSRQFTVDVNSGVLTHGQCRGKRAGSLAGYLTARGYTKVSVGGNHYFAHRIVWKLVHGSDPVGEIDHINMCKTDNRPCNLRDVDGKTNRANVVAPRGSEMVGVYFNKKKQKWQARIEVHVGWFLSAVSAKEAREAAASAVSAAIESSRKAHSPPAGASFLGEQGALSSD